MNKSFILALASFIGTIIGAGIFGVPYIMAKAGVIPCIFYFIVLGLCVLFLHLAFGEIVFRTKEKHYLVGYAEKYLGKKAKVIVAITTFLGVIGSLLAYIILSGNFLNIIFPQFTTNQWSLIAWTLLSLFVLLGIHSIAKMEVIMNLALFLVIFIIFGFSFSKIEATNLHLIKVNNIFLPIGVILFSLIGMSAVPEISHILKRKRDFKKVSILTMLIVIPLTFLFGLIVSGVTGEQTTQEAFLGLSSFLGHKVIVLGGIFGILAVCTSFLILANYLKNTLRFDYKFPVFLSFVIACFAPLLLFLLGFRQFIFVISIVGTFVGLIEGIFLVLIYKKAKKTGDQKPAFSLSVPTYIPYLVLIILFCGAFFQFIYG